MLEMLSPPYAAPQLAECEELKIRAVHRDRRGLVDDCFTCKHSQFIIHHALGI